MVREALSKVLNVRISETEHAMLETISEDTGLSMGALLRQFIRADFTQRYPGRLISVERRIDAFNVRTAAGLAKTKKRRSTKR